MTDDEIIEVVKAHKDGKQIQDQKLPWSVWSDCAENPRWNFEEFNYRVKPEPRKPREWTVVVKGNCISSCWAGDEHIQVREVLQTNTSET